MTTEAISMMTRGLWTLGVRSRTMTRVRSAPVLCVLVGVVLLVGSSPAWATADPARHAEPVAPAGTRADDVTRLDVKAVPDVSAALATLPEPALAPTPEAAALHAAVPASGATAFGGVEVQSSPGSSDVAQYYGYDALGSVRVVFDAAGNVTGQATYAPYGQEVYGSTGLPSQRFTGQERDHEAGLDYFNARSYAVRLGRFSSPDPVKGRGHNPQSWNRYGYALNNPLTNVDPSGLQPCALLDGMDICAPPPLPSWPDPFPGPSGPCDYNPDCGSIGGPGGGPANPLPPGPPPVDPEPPAPPPQCEAALGVAGDCAGGPIDEPPKTDKDDDCVGMTGTRFANTWGGRVVDNFQFVNSYVPGMGGPPGMGLFLGVGGAMSRAVGQPTVKEAAKAVWTGTSITTTAATFTAREAVVMAGFAVARTFLAVTAAWEVGVLAGSMVSAATVHPCANR